LAYAVKIAHNLFGDSKRLVVQFEVDIPAVEVPEIGRVKGSLDYLTCHAAGTLPMSKCTSATLKADFFRKPHDGSDVKPSTPFFICVEATTTCPNSCSANLKVINLKMSF